MFRAQGHKVLEGVLIIPPINRLRSFPNARSSSFQRQGLCAHCNDISVLTSQCMRAHRAASVYCSERIESPFLDRSRLSYLQNKSLVLGTLLGGYIAGGRGKRRLTRTHERVAARLKPSTSSLMIPQCVRNVHAKLKPSPQWRADAFSRSFPRCGLHIYCWNRH